MASLTFYGAVNEIGGNKIILEDKGTKIFLDFGMSFGQANLFFSEFLQPRKCNGLGDFFEFGLIPDLKGLYRQDYLKKMGRPKEDVDFQGVLLSHAHADHASFINHLREDVPIYCSPETFHILKALNDTASGSFGDLTQLSKCFETYINKKGEESRKNSRSHPDIVIDRNFVQLTYKKPFNIDHIQIVPYSVDHSLCGATGYIIHTSQATIVYTGDFRFHGRREKQTVEFMQACQKAKPDVLIIEGTRINDQKTETETDVEKQIYQTANQSKALCIGNWPIRDVDRMLSFLNSAKQMNRKLVISLKQAYLLEELAKSNAQLIPKIDDPDIVLYAGRKSWGLIGSECNQRILNQDYDPWERAYLEKAICYKDVKENQEKYLMFCSNFDLKELIDIKPNPNSVYIKSVCEPFDVEMEIDWERIHNWIKHFGLKLQATHVSGHACALQLKKFVETVKPKTLIPIHTQNAQIYKKYTPNVHLLHTVPETYQIAN